MESILSGLSKIQHARCWKKADIPERLRYNDGGRIASIVCSADEGWFMTTRERYEGQKKGADFARSRGAHGYDNNFQSMQATFIARGKAFKKGKIVEPFPNVDVYELMCKILKLKPAKNDGNFADVKGMLR